MPLNLPKLRLLMGERRQCDIAKVAGISRPELSAILAGRRPNPTLRRLESLATALGVKASSLIE